MTDAYEGIDAAAGECDSVKLSKRWLARALVLQRGKRYALGSYLRAPHVMANNFWNPPFKEQQRPT